VSIGLHVACRRNVCSGNLGAVPELVQGVERIARWNDSGTAPKLSRPIMDNRRHQYGRGIPSEMHRDDTFQGIFTEMPGRDFRDRDRWANFVRSMSAKNWISTLQGVDRLHVACGATSAPGVWGPSPN
jgi:hypothetical protein